MYNDFDENVKPEVITFSDLKDLDYKSFRRKYKLGWMAYNKEKEYPNKSLEEIKAEVKEEIKKAVEKSAKETKEKYYEINSEKTKELKQKFKQKELKVNSGCDPKILRDGKFYTISQGCFTVYDDKLLKKLYEIKLEKNFNVISVIQLDNKDLVFSHLVYLRYID